MQNLIEKTPKHKKDDEKDGEEKKKRPIIKSATDLQRLKLEKLMKNPDKPIIIPETPREKDYLQTVPSFVRNVMGSSAGAGSGEFHVYRHLRRKEYARQKCIHAKSMREQLDDEYQTKLEKNRLEAESKTAKKRAKRLKKKQRAKKPKTQKNDDSEKHNTTDDDDDDEDAQSIEKNENEKITEDADLKKAMVVNDDVDICKDTAGPQPKEEISISPNQESNQVEVAQSCSNADERNRNIPENDNMENDKQNEIEAKEISKTKEDLSSYETGKQEADLEDKTLEDSIKDPISIYKLK